jgi:drug/metabolite transporter (DMT)-like permease
LSEHTRGVVLGLLASACWATTFVGARYVTYVRSIDPIYTAALRFGVGAVVATGYMLAIGRWRQLMRASSDLGGLAMLGAIGIFGMGALVFISARYTTSINSSLVLNSNAIFIAIFALMAGERVPAIRSAGLLIGLAGCAAIVVGNAPPQPLPAPNNVLGSLVAVGGAACWAAYTVLGKRYVRRHGGPEVATGALIFGALMLIILAVARGPLPSLEWQEAAAALYLGVVPTALAMLVWYHALEMVDASVLGPTQYLAPVGSSLLGWWLLGESIGRWFLGGAAGILLGVYLATKPVAERKHSQ